MWQQNMCKITVIKNVTLNSCANFDKQNLPLAFKAIRVYESALNVIKIFQTGKNNLLYNSTFW
jgi:hypothetical protein